MTTKDLINDNRNKIEGIVNMTTEEILQSMLKESTGINFLDSGGSDGRHWQKNQGVAFDNEPEVEVDYNWMREGDRIEFRINVYHFLKHALTSDAMTDEFNSLFNVMNDWDGYGYGLSDEASGWLIDNFRVCPKDLSNDWINTYNGDSNLSQVLQYRYIGDGYIILQIHNGADVRGGYTDAKLFRLIGDGLYEGVFGRIVYPDGRGVDVSTFYDGWSLTTDDGVEVLFEEGMIIDLNLVEC
jgi:hypothetical protein